MLILALETSGLAGSVALIDGERAWTGELPTGLRSAQGLAPAVRELLRKAGLDISAIKLVAVTSGPGSFTGLRVGVMTAKTLAFALGCSCLGVNTLDVIAWQATEFCSAGDYPDRCWAVLDAQRRQVFAAAYSWDAQNLRCVRPTAIEDHAAWLAELRPGDLVTGPGLSALRSQVEARAGVKLVAEAAWQPHAVAVARVAWRDYVAGRRDDPWKLMPQYFRSSAAEEKARLLPPATL